jgi:bifunctional DNA-binding transcriptional regulator/antitoxin component of YhaV-PrlF toxin-antitoxin module
MTYATISSKGQITLPVKFLRGLGLKPKDRIEIEQSGDQLKIRKADDFLALRGSLKGRGPKDLKEIKAAMMKGVAAHVMGRKA